jgi:hypothetical protein
MVNYEPALEGGYRRISGFTNDYGTLPGLIGEPTLGIAVYQEINDGIFGCRRPQSGNDYFHYWDATNEQWVTPSTTGNPTMVGVEKVRFAKLRWGVPLLVLTDGVNPGATWDGTTYSQITDPLAPSAPRFSEDFSSHLFLAGDPAEPNLVYFSAPFTATDFDPANGAGVINVGFEVTAIKSFRDQLYIFGSTQIKVLTGNTLADFVLDDVTKNVGTVSPDTVVEFNGDVIFLSADGLRPISGTDRIGDIELNVLSKPVQNIFETLYNNEDLTQMTTLVVGRKTQFRMFLNNSESFGIIGSIRRSGDGGQGFEYSQLVGISVSAGDSSYIGATEFVIHGDSVGRVFRQESGIDFNGSPVFSLYQTPYLYMDDPIIRKTIYDVNTYMRSEGEIRISLGLTYDYGDTNVLKPSDEVLGTQGVAAFWDSATYDTTDIYDGNPSPLTRTPVRGSGRSVSLTYVTTDSQPSHTIQAYVVSYALHDRR